MTSFIRILQTPIMTNAQTLNNHRYVELIGEHQLRQSLLRIMNQQTSSTMVSATSNESTNIIAMLKEVTNIIATLNEAPRR